MILTDGTHLVSTDGVEELHQFARCIGLKRHWFQRGKSRRHPHYDLSKGMPQRAVLAGAHKVTSKELVKLAFGRPTT
jgi:hypothetical protein